MTLTELLWANWEEWSRGGLDAERIEASVTPDDHRRLRDWLVNGLGESRTAEAAGDLKWLTDLATWSLHGTHSLLLKPMDMRLTELRHVAARFQISEDVLADLIASAHVLSED